MREYEKREMGNGSAKSLHDRRSVPMSRHARMNPRQGNWKGLSSSLYVTEDRDRNSTEKKRHTLFSTSSQIQQSD